MTHTDPTEQISVQVSLPDQQIPTLLRRVSAKMIDFVALAATIVGFSSVTGSYVAGLLIGYAWLAISDSGGSWGKWALKLEVRDYDTGRECSPWASFLRNLPIIALALPYRLHQAFLGVDRQQYRQDHSTFLLVMAGIFWIFLLATVFIVSRNAERRHLGDYLARTVVVLRSSKPSPRSESSP